LEPPSSYHPGVYGEKIARREGGEDRSESRNLVFNMWSSSFLYQKKNEELVKGGTHMKSRRFSDRSIPVSGFLQGSSLLGIYRPASPESSIKCLREREDSKVKIFEVGRNQEGVETSLPTENYRLLSQILTVPSKHRKGNPKALKKSRPSRISRRPTSGCLRRDW